MDTWTLERMVTRRPHVVERWRPQVGAVVEIAKVGGLALEKEECVLLLDEHMFGSPLIVVDQLSSRRS